MDIDRISSEVRSRMTELLADPLFEVIPMSNVTEQVSHLAPGSRVSVTASPVKTLEDSLDLCAQLVDRGFRVTPHLSARMTRDMAHLESLLARITSIGLTGAFVVGGDAAFTGAFYDGLSLLEAMEKIGHDLDLGVPAYPEGHPDIDDSSLASALAAKQPHATHLTTQMCFDGAVVSRWLRSIRVEGITLPVVLGLPGAADRMHLLKISTRIGVGGSLSFLRKNTGMISAFVRPGGYDPGTLLEDLGEDLLDIDAGIVGLHIYTFNQCDKTERWRQEVLAAL